MKKILAVPVLALLLAACPAGTTPPPNAPPWSQQAADAAKLVGCIAADVVQSKSIFAIAVDCAGGVEQVVIDILADLGVKLPNMYADDPRVQAAVAKLAASKKP